MFRDFSDLLRAFEKHKVRYVVIGGYALAIHGEPRYTRDLDILIEPTPGNANRMLRALAEFGAPIDNLSVEDLTTPGLLYIFGVPPLRVDIMNCIKRVDVSKIIAKADKVSIEEVTMRVVNLKDFIKLKTLAGRPQDKADLATIFRLHPHLKKRSSAARKRRKS